MKEDFDPKRLVSYLIILAIAFIFAVQWGPGSKGCETMGKQSQSATAAAYVNGKEIPLKEFQRAYAMQLRYFQSQGNPIPEALARQLGMPNQVLEQLVTRELLSQEAERQGIQPSDKELRELIHSNPEFQVEGKFDMARYQDVVTNYARKTIQDFEHDLRRQLAAQKLLEVVDQTAQISDDEVKAHFLKEGNKADITYVRFLPALFAVKATAPTAAELAAFKKDHAKEISESYTANQFAYKQPEKVRARHILIKVDRSAPADQQAAAKTKLEALRKEIEGGKDFAEVAKASSEDVGSKPSGGDLGFNDRAGWVPEFSAAAFALKPGELSQPVQSQFGWHLIKVEEKKAAESRELKDVENEIATQLIAKEKTRALAKVEAEKALATAKGGKTLAELFPPEKDNQPAALRFETETRPEAVATGEFSSSSDTIPHLGAAPELNRAVFATQAPALLDQVYPAGDAWVVAQVTARKLASDAEFTAQKDKLRDEARRAKQVELREAYMKALKKAAEVKTNAELVAESAERS